MASKLRETQEYSGLNTTKRDEARTGLRRPAGMIAVVKVNGLTQTPS